MHVSTIYHVRYMSISVHVGIWSGSNQKISLSCCVSGREACKTVFVQYTITIINPAHSTYNRTQQTDPHQSLINDTICLPDRGQQRALVFIISCNCTSFSHLGPSFLLLSAQSSWVTKSFSNHLFCGIYTN